MKIKAMPEIEDHFIRNVPIPDVELPALSEDFFSKTMPPKLSSFGFEYQVLLNPNISSVASTIVNVIAPRGEDEAKTIEKTDSIVDLLRIAKKGGDTLNRDLRRSKFLKRPGENIPLLLAELKGAVDDMFLEFALDTIVRAKINVADDLIRMILLRDKSAYQIAVLCLILGFFPHPAAPQILWNHYCFFRSKFPRENY